VNTDNEGHEREATTSTGSTTRRRKEKDGVDGGHARPTAAARSAVNVHRCGRRLALLLLDGRRRRPARRRRRLLLVVLCARPCSCSLCIAILGLDLVLGLADRLARRVKVPVRVVDRVAAAEPFAFGHARSAGQLGVLQLEDARARDVVVARLGRGEDLLEVGVGERAAERRVEERGESLLRVVAERAAVSLAGSRRRARDDGRAAVREEEGGREGAASARRSRTERGASARTHDLGV